MGTLTRTLLQNLEVLSAGTDFKKDAEGKPVQVQVINLLVTPEQAELAEPGQHPDTHSVGAAQSAGSRSDQDAGHGPGLPFHRRQVEAAEAELAPSKPRVPRSSAARQSRASGRDRLPRRAPKKEEPFVMEIISGTKKAEAQIRPRRGGQIGAATPGRPNHAC